MAAAAAVVVVAVGLTILVGSSDNGENTAGQRVTASGALACPHSYQRTARGKQPWVPATSRGAIDGGVRMVPDLKPQHVVVCAYLGGPREPRTGASPVSISGHRELRGDLGPVIDTVTWLPKGKPESTICPAYLGATDGNDYLLGLTYAGGTVWVSAPGDHCAGSSNGSFNSPANLGAYAAAAYSRGTWVPDPPSGEAHQPSRNACTPSGQGRLGQDTKLVPGSPKRVTVCGGSGKRASVTTGHVSTLVRALNKLATTTSTGGCEGTSTSSYDLRFRYATGPDVLVRVSPGCRPAVDNGSLQATGTGSVTPQLERILGTS